MGCPCKDAARTSDLTLYSYTLPCSYALFSTGPNALEELFPHDAPGLQGYIAAGVSPRSDQEDEEGDEFGAGAEDDEGKARPQVKVRSEWLSPEVTAN